jgi:ribosomal protein S18 acetylase RimI-like enzyme
MGHHYGAFTLDENNSEITVPVAVISLFKETLPIGILDSESDREKGDSSSSSAARFRKFACDPSHQGMGIGTGLLRHVFNVAKEELNCSVVWCDARTETAGWYERRGMQRFGSTFYKGPIEYVRMKMEI